MYNYINIYFTGVMSVLVNHGYLESGDSDNPSLKGLKKVC